MPILTFPYPYVCYFPYRLVVPIYIKMYVCSVFDEVRSESAYLKKT